MSLVSVNKQELRRVVREFAAHWTSEAVDIESYLAAQVDDETHREVVGPLLAASGASGVVRVGGQEAAVWGDPTVPEMAFSVTKSVVSVVAGVAFDDGLLVPDQPVHQVVDVPEFRGPRNELITWRHLLQQSSQWEGALWGKPSSVDAQSFREGTEVHGTPPGAGWAYNDVRMNLLTYALTLLMRRSLSEVLRERVMTPIGASDRWSWHGYRTSVVEIDGRPTEVVSGGAHWGGGLFIAARDLALIGQLFLNGGTWAATRVLSSEWIDRSWAPGPVKHEYGYLWWLNDERIPWPGAPSTGRSARGNGGRHLLWVDPARELVIASHWTEDPLGLVRRVSETVSASRGC
ncbi:serine hydrolase [Micromonospora sp. NPDC093244]|uniref:serine hydrolase domain-containing protein n=1 Tax=Micromonospora sp. NPDC093244 TaxID=3155071 RepID=UPI00344A770A